MVLSAATRDRLLTLSLHAVVLLRRRRPLLFTLVTPLRSARIGPSQDVQVPSTPGPSDLFRAREGAKRRNARPPHGRPGVCKPYPATRSGANPPVGTRWADTRRGAYITPANLSLRFLHPPGRLSRASPFPPSPRWGFPKWYTIDRVRPDEGELLGSLYAERKAVRPGQLPLHVGAGELRGM